MDRSLTLSSCHQANCSKYRQLFLQNSGSQILAYIRVPNRAVKMQPRVSDLANLGWGVRICIADSAGLGSTLWELLLYYFLGNTTMALALFMYLFMWVYLFETNCCLMSEIFKFFFCFFSRGRWLNDHEDMTAHSDIEVDNIFQFDAVLGPHRTC